LQPIVVQRSSEADAAEDTIGRASAFRIGEWTESAVEPEARIPSFGVMHVSRARMDLDRDGRYDTHIAYWEGHSVSSYAVESGVEIELWPVRHLDLHSTPVILVASSTPDVTGDAWADVFLAPVWDPELSPGLLNDRDVYDTPWFALCDVEARDRVSCQRIVEIAGTGAVVGVAGGDDADGDGTPDLAVLLCSSAGSEASPHVSIARFSCAAGRCEAIGGIRHLPQSPCERAMLVGSAWWL